MSSPNLPSYAFWLQPFESMHDSYLKSPTGKPSPTPLTQQMPQQPVLQSMLDMGSPQLPLKEMSINCLKMGLKSGLQHFGGHSQDDLMLAAPNYLMGVGQDSQKIVRMNDIHPTQPQQSIYQQQNISLDAFQMIDIENIPSTYECQMETQNQLSKRTSMAYSQSNSSTLDSEESGFSFRHHRSVSEPFIFNTSPINSDCQRKPGSHSRRDSLASIRSDVSNGSQRSMTMTASIGSRQVIYHDNGERKFECTRCDKRYRNMNGLKYHLTHVHSVQEGIPLDVLLADRKKELEGNESRPFDCPVEGCTKRYKNPNGLKYHLEHGHLNDDDTLLSPAESPMETTMIETFLLDTGFGDKSSELPSFSASSSLPRRLSQGRGSTSSVIRRKASLPSKLRAESTEPKYPEYLSNGEVAMISDFGTAGHQPLTPTESMAPLTFMDTHRDSAVSLYAYQQKQLQHNQDNQAQNTFLSPDSLHGELFSFF